MAVDDVGASFYGKLCLEFEFGEEDAIASDFVFEGDHEGVAVWINCAA